jgi:hypothetical protein
MPLPWVRFDSSFPTHDKVLELVAFGAAGRSAAFVYTCSLAYCGAQGTDGIVPFAALPFVHGRKRDADLLVQVKLWRPHPQGWEVPNWLTRQQSAARSEAIVRGKRKAGVMGNCVRWHGPDCGCWRGDEGP